MPFEKGRSGNPKGRPKQTAEQKSQKEQFQRLLKSSTVEALQSIIQIASDRYNKDRFNACKYIIDKAYGANTAFLLDGTEETTPKDENGDYSLSEADATSHAITYTPTDDNTLKELKIEE